MAKKKSNPAEKPEENSRFVLLEDGTRQRIVREDGKYYYTASSQFRRLTHRTVTESAEQAESKPDIEADEE